MPEAKVSIIIPCFNAEKYVAEAIQSALDQSYANCEIIVIDDGSTDGSLEVIKRFGERIRYETGQNRGGCAARNRGFKLSTGKYIQFLDADDRLPPSKIETQLKALQGEGAGTVATCGWRYFDDSGERAPSRRPFWRSYTVGKDLLVDMWMNGGFFNPACWLVSRDLVEKAGPWREDLSADQDGEFFGRVLLEANRVAFVEEIETFYRMPQADNVSRSVSEKALWSRAEAIRSLAQAMGGERASGRARAAIRKRWLGFAYFSSQYDKDWMNRALAEVDRYPGSKEWPDDVSGSVLRVLGLVIGMPNAIRLRRRLTGMVSSYIV